MAAASKALAVESAPNPTPDAVDVSLQSAPAAKQELFKRYGIWLLWTLVLYGVCTGYFTAWLKVALAVRKDRDYFDQVGWQSSRFRIDDPPAYNSQPEFPWQLIAASTSGQP